MSNRKRTEAAKAFIAELAYQERAQFNLRIQRTIAVEALEKRVAKLEEMLEECAELINLWASKAGCQTEDAALKSDAEDFGSLSILTRISTVLKSKQ